MTKQQNSLCRACNIKFAFTLAEVLITLTIIGVVAALTIPTLLSNYQKQVYVTGLKKMNSVVQNAAKLMYISEDCPIGDNNCFSVSGSVTRDGYTFYDQQEYTLYLLSKQLKAVRKTCNSASISGAFCYDTYNDYKYYENDKTGIDYNMTLADGTLIFRTSNGLVFDVNGTKGPNKIGRDMFLFDSMPNENGILAYKTDNNFKTKCTRDSVNNKNNYDAYYCTQRVLMEDKMDY